MKYIVNEIYPCLQGEGTNLGKPSLLIRFHICNLRCSWCDTPYTHTFKSDPIEKNYPNGKQKYSRYSLDDLVIQIKRQKQTHLILSGGEPSLQNLGLLMRTLGSNYSAEVESNGTQIPHQQIKNFLESDYELMQWNISPKFSNAGEMIVPEAMEHWAELSKKHQQVYFKFVVREREHELDMRELLNIVQKYNISQEKVLLMPEGTSINSQTENIWLHDLCLNYGFRYTPRLHVLLFGNLRGV